MQVHNFRVTGSPKQSQTRRGELELGGLDLFCVLKSLLSSTTALTEPEALLSAQQAAQRLWEHQGGANVLWVSFQHFARLLFARRISSTTQFQENMPKQKCPAYCGTLGGQRLYLSLIIELYMTRDSRNR